MASIRESEHRLKARIIADQGTIVHLSILACAIKLAPAHIQTRSCYFPYTFDGTCSQLYFLT